MNLKVFQLIFVCAFLFGHVNLLALEMSEKASDENSAYNAGFAVGLGTLDPDDTLADDQEYQRGLDDAKAGEPQNFDAQKSPLIEENSAMTTGEPQIFDDQSSSEDNLDAWSTTAEWGEEEPVDSFYPEDSFSGPYAANF